MLAIAKPDIALVWADNLSQTATKTSVLTKNKTRKANFEEKIKKIKFENIFLLSNGDLENFLKMCKIIILIL